MEAHQLSSVQSIHEFGVYRNSDFAAGETVYFNEIRLEGELPQNLVVGNLAFFLFENIGPDAGDDEMVSREQRLIDTWSRHFVASECQVPRIGKIYGHVASLYDKDQLWLSRAVLAGGNNWQPESKDHVGYQRTAARLIHAAVCGVTVTRGVHSVLSPGATRYERAFYERIGMEVVDYGNNVVGATASSASALRNEISSRFNLSEGLY